MPTENIAGYTPPRVFTTGQIAKLTRVAPRTVTKWFDAGRLDGYRIPGSLDRRVPLPDLIAFFKKNGMPIPVGLDPSTRLVAVAVEDAVPGLERMGAFAAIAAVLRGEVGAVVIGCADGVGRAVELAREIRARAEWVRVAILLGPDTDATAVPADLFPCLVPYGANPDLIAAWAVGDSPNFTSE